MNKITLDAEQFKAQLMRISEQRITVGVYSERNAAVPKLNTEKRLTRGSGGLEIENKALRVNPSKRSGIKLTKLAEILDRQYHWIDIAYREMPQAKKTIDTIMQWFVNNGTSEQPTRFLPNHIRAGAISLLSRPITQKKLGSNSQSTIDRKGFDAPLVQTGSILNNIDAKFERAIK